MTFHLVNYHIIFNKFAYLNRLPNGTFIGMIREIQDGLVDTSVAGFNWIPERSEIVDFTQGLALKNWFQCTMVVPNDEFW